MSMLPQGPDGFAIPAADLLADQLTECGCNDPETDDPARWLSWTDADTWELGPPCPPDAVIDLNGDELAEIDDLLERMRYEQEAGCNARFV